MRFTELLEYSRAKTAEMTGDKLLVALLADSSGGNAYGVRNSLKYALHQIITDRNKTVQQYLDADPKADDKRVFKLPRMWLPSEMTMKDSIPSIEPNEKRGFIDAMLGFIEEKDPTTNKEYTPWLARMYANGNLKLEDINRFDNLSSYHNAKRRNKLPPTTKDINSFKTYKQFEDFIEDNPELFNKEGDIDQKEAIAKKVYEDSDVTVIIPENEAAACKYGRNTRWCTSATKGQNQFDVYNRDGPLYIIIPKKPSHEGEKYQLHFPSEQYMDENDDEISLPVLLEQRFPKLKEFFMKLYPNLKDNIYFMDNSILSDLIGQVADLADIKLNDILRDWETNDEGYYQWLENNTYVDNNGQIDWEKVADNDAYYTAYNDEANTFLSKAEDLLRPTVKEFKKLHKDEYDSKYESYDEIPTVIANNLERNFRRNGDASLGSYIRRNIMIRKEGDGFKVYDRSATEPVKEGIRDTLKKGALAATVGAGLTLAPGIKQDLKTNMLPAQYSTQTVMPSGSGTTYVSKKQPQVDPRVVQQVHAMMKKPAAVALKREAVAQGLQGDELAQFLAQAAHETLNFSSLKELGNKKDFKKYDIRYNPSMAKALGNTRKGDGQKYIGRGFLQITGKYNYDRIGKILKLDLKKHPELLERPSIAAKASLAYWKNRVNPNVNDFSNTTEVTKPINSSLRGLPDRHQKFLAMRRLIDPNELNEYKVDNSKGLGKVPHNSNVDYRGLRVLMKPSTFIKLAPSIDHDETIDYIEQYMKNGGALGSPYLVIDIPEEWTEENKFRKMAKVVAHEGRHRMMAIQRLEGDDPVEVHIIPNGEIRARHLNDNVLKYLNKSLISQTGHGLAGPFFTVI
jgi:putative chitinase